MASQCVRRYFAINTRLDAAVIAFQLDHAEAKIVIVDREFMPVMQDALERATIKPLLIQYDDPEYDEPKMDVAALDYDLFVAAGDADFAWLMPRDEWDAISINYIGDDWQSKRRSLSPPGGSSVGTGNALTTSMGKHAVYLWTLPMFHCNGWCFPWTLSAITGTHVCLRHVRDEPIWEALATHNVTHLCGAPIVMSLIIAACDSVKRNLDNVVEFFTAAAPPPQQVLADMGRV